MLRATTVVRRPAVKAERVVDTLTLDHEARHRRRVGLSSDGGLSFLLDLDRASVLDDGDALRLEDGSLVQVKAAPERLLEIRTDNPLRLTKIAWHIGNRHVAAELTADAIYIAHDHVLGEMVRGLGGTATVVERPFRPERGAYHEHGPDCGHDHHDHAPHDHAHGDHAHRYASDEGSQGHAHDAGGCGHGHAEDSPERGHHHHRAGHAHAHSAGR